VNSRWRVRDPLYTLAQFPETFSSHHQHTVHNLQMSTVLPLVHLPPERRRCTPAGTQRHTARLGAGRGSLLLSGTGRTTPEERSHDPARDTLTLLASAFGPRRRISFSLTTRLQATRPRHNTCPLSFWFTLETPIHQLAFCLY
jgi:hypothetical protein